ncbi:MAG: hypothetical protein HOE69_07130 [Euryarchaeota archaeon]|nr:hypothetical protein [Euryarchaeota archaeon]
MENMGLWDRLDDWIVKNEDQIKEKSMAIASISGVSVFLWWAFTLLVGAAKPCLEDGLWCDVVYWWIPLNPYRGGAASFLLGIGYGIIIPIGILTFIIGHNIEKIVSNIKKSKQNKKD